MAVQDARIVTRSRSNRWKERWAYLLIGVIAWPWRLGQRLSGGKLPIKDHYYIMKLFRLLFKTYEVYIAYPNPLAPDHQLKLKLDLCENSHQWFFRMRGSFDASEMRLIADAMKDADTFLDVGANIGIYSITVAQAFPEKKVHAIEALPSNHARLAENIAINGLSNCVSWQKAVVSGESGKLRFYVNPIHDGGGSLIAPDMFRTGDVEIDIKKYQRGHPGFQPWVEVETMRLNELVFQKGVLKVDVEGSEVDVLRSLGDTLVGACRVDLMVVEVLQETVDDVIRLASAAQMDCFLMPDLEPIQVGIKLPWFVSNVVCVRHGTPLLERLREKQFIS
ncbi:MAG: FkbM family methyltransferase [Anaerolineales bacterium]